MPQDPNLYGQRPAKKKKGEMGLSNTLGFAAQLQSIISSSSKPKPKPSSSSSSFSRHATLSSSLKKRPREEEAETNSKTKQRPVKGKANWIKGPSQPAGDTPLDEHERERIRKNMANKAKRYAAMQRGDYISKEGEASSLVDFDRKWAERREQREQGGGRGDKDSDDSGDNDDNDKSDGSSDDYSGSDFEADRKTMVEYQDEYGRTRTISKAERDRDLRRKARAARAAKDLEDMSALPVAPAESRIIYGDVIQTHAIETTMDQIGKTPLRKDEDDEVADTHYRAGDDVRTRGAAFYAFAANDEAKREAQMRALAEERKKTETARSQTEKARSDRSAQLEARRQEMAARRAALEEKKAKKQADNFLDGLGDLLGE